MPCDCPAPDRPTLAGFLTFVRDVMGITTAQLPDNSPWLALSYCLAKEIVNEAILIASPLLYQQAVYNLAGSNLLNFTQDQLPIVPYPANSDSTVGFFAYTRKLYNMLGFVSGIIQAAADESTSESMVVPEQFKDFTVANLQQLKDPYGRAYLGIAQAYGPSLWGLT
jgi:hypothetical protein